VVLARTTKIKLGQARGDGLTSGCHRHDRHVLGVNPLESDSNDPSGRCRQTLIQALTKEQRRVRERLNPDLPMSGILACRVDARSRPASDTLASRRLVPVARFLPVCDLR
jgi:hypothetical protein